jgi:phenylacetate-CoA ligase
MNQLYLSANHISSRNAGAYLEALRRYRIDHMIVYTSSAAALAQEFLDAGYRHEGLKVVFTNAEPVSPEQRRVIEDAFGTVVRETYGMVEIAVAASQCDAGTMHLWPEAGVLEIVEDSSDSAVSPGTVGRFLCTGLLNVDMPLIRYAVGDRGSLPASQTPCACGRSLPALRSIEGRTNDTLLAQDGRKVFWLNPVFYGVPVREAQIIQEAIGAVRVVLVPAVGFTRESGDLITARLRARLGEVRVAVETVEEIPRGPNGKFQAVVCRVRESH